MSLHQHCHYQCHTCFTLVFICLRTDYMECIGKPFQCQQRCRSCYEVSYPNAAIARFSAFIKQQDYHVFFPPHHCIKYHVCSYILWLQVWSVSCFARRDLRVTAVNVLSSMVQNVILGTTHSLLCVHLVPISPSLENHIVWIQIKPFMSHRLNHCMWIISSVP